MRLRKMAVLVICLFVACAISIAGQAIPTHRPVHELRMEGFSGSVDARETAPVFRWNYYDDRGEGVKVDQVSAHVVLAKEGESFSFDRFADGKGLIWDSGLSSTPLLSIRYGGPALEPGTKYIWRLETNIGGDAVPSGWSTSGEFRTTQQGQVAKWIQAPWSTERDGAELDGSRPMPLFEKEIVVRQGLRSATLKISGLGQWQARLDDVDLSAKPGLHQAWTDYRKTVTYSEINLNAAFGLKQPVRTYVANPAPGVPRPPEPKTIAAGSHRFTIMLGNGMYNVQRTKGRYTKFAGSFGVPKVMAELRLTYLNGTTDVIGTDESWQVIAGPVTFSSIYGGEDYDARREPAGMQDAGWSKAVVVEGPGGAMKAELAPDVQVTHTYDGYLKSVEVNKLVYDFDQNMAGRPRIVVKGPAGAVLKLTPGELLKPDGSVSQASSGGPMYWTYTLKGGGKPEEWEPQFGYYGFRYLQAEWSGAALPAAQNGLNAQRIPSARIVEVEGRQLSSASKVTGSFSSSNETLNAIHKLIVEAMHNNEVSLFTDCPHREKLGWLEETHLVANALMYNNDLRGLYAATAQNIEDAQHDDGDVPTITPQYTKFGPQYAIYDTSPEWGSASVLGQWAAYRFYGDRKALVNNYAVMQKYVAFLESKAVDGIVAYGLGDWYDIGPGGPGFSKLTTLGVTGTLMLYEDAVAMEKISGLVGKPDDAKKYKKLAEKTRAAFNARFFDAAKGFYDTGSQTAQAMPLALGIVPEDAKARVLAKLIDDIKAHDDHVTAGEVGYPYLMRVLMDTGHDDLLMAMMMRKDPPSYASQLAAGATSLTEAWDANPKSSQDHFMLGAGDEWFYRGLGGIDVDMSRGYEQQVIIRPHVVDGVDRVWVSYDSVQGKIESNWKRGKGETIYDITVPNGVRATVILPGQTQVLSGSLHVTVKDAAK